MARVIFLLLVLAVSLGAYQTKPPVRKDGSGDHAAKPQNKKADNNLNNSSEAVTQQTANHPPSTNPNEAIAGSTSDDPQEWVNFLNAISTAVIAVFTVALFLGVIKQITTSRNIERAWVMVEIQPDLEKPSDGRLQVFESSGTDGDSTAAMNVVLNCSNAGKTPAWIEEVIAKFEMVKSLPETPNFESAQSIQRSTIPLGMAEGGTVPHTQKIRWTPIAKGHQNTDEMAVIYGRVAYRDIFGRQRTTTFGYKLRPHGGLERLDGHSKYNKNT
jgi:hypothetical protein